MPLTLNNKCINLLTLNPRAQGPQSLYVLLAGMNVLPQYSPGHFSTIFRALSVHVQTPGFVYVCFDQLLHLNRFGIGRMKRLYANINAQLQHKGLCH